MCAIKWKIHLFKDNNWWLLKLLKIKKTNSKFRFKHMLNIYTKFSGHVKAVPQAEWLARFPFDYYFPSSSRDGRNIFFKDHWNVPAIQSTKWSMNGNWNATENHLSRHHSVAIQPPFSHHSVDWKVRFHPVIFLFYCLII